MAIKTTKIPTFKSIIQSDLLDKKLKKDLIGFMGSNKIKIRFYFLS